MSADSRRLIRYLRECYRENGSRGGLWNVFADSVSHRIFLKDADFLAERPEAQDTRYLRESGAGTAARQARLYRKEKDLVYASVFVISRVEAEGGRPEMVCAPVFVIPAELDTEGLPQGATLRIDPARRQLNLAVLEAIGGEAFARRMESAVDPAAVSEGDVGEVRRLFSEAFPGAGTEALLGYPHLIGGRELKERLEAIEGREDFPPVLLPAACVALVNKSAEMRGVLNELDSMADESTRLSAPASVLLGGAPPSMPPAPAGRVPATLSRAQQAILQSARVHALTLAIGPPGTGKTFTIAALAIETLSRGGSVLIASKMDHAVDVVARKIEESIGLDGVVTRGGRSAYLKRLKDFIDELLAGMHTAPTTGDGDLRAARRSLLALENRIARLTVRLTNHLRREQKRGRLLSDPAPGFFRRILQSRLRQRLGQTTGETPLWETAAEIEGLIDSRHRAVVTWLKSARSRQLERVLKSQRAILQDFSRALRSRSGARQETYFQKIGIRRLLGALPVWLVNLSDVHRVLPLEGEAFDLAIIDEATQCDISSALPILQRARRAVITGDPKQLRHLSFLAGARQTAIAEQFDLDEIQRERWNFRDTSLLDAVSASIADQGQVAFLDEHFRSRPEIIAFSNREFYGGKLHIMTGHRREVAPCGPPLRLEHLPRGRRDEDGVNRIEAGAVIAAVESLRLAESALPPHLVHSIGILSPFRDQVDHFFAQISRHPAAEALLSRHDLLIGTAHTFQGEERDLMFLSLVLDNASPETSYRFLEKPDVFNVSITRARLGNWIWHSFDPARLDAASLVARYLGQANEPAGRPPQPLPARDTFAAEVADCLKALGCEVCPRFPLAGTEVDLVCFIAGKAWGIDLIGYPGGLADAFPLERMLAFRRAGLPILPLPYSAWKCRRDACIEKFRDLAVGRTDKTEGK